MDLTDVQWAVLEPTFRPRRRPDGRGRPWTVSEAFVDATFASAKKGALKSVQRAVAKAPRS
jgi:hypothetical protein